MNWTRKAWVLWALGFAAAFAPGCSSETPEDGEEEEGELNASKPGQWVVRMDKVKELYGASSKYFFGLAPEEAGLCKAGEERCAQIPPVWDQLLSYHGVKQPVHRKDQSGNYGLSPDRDKDSAIEHTMVAPTEETPVIKLEDGKILKVKGKTVNIIPMLRDTDPTDQLHIREWMQNGDVMMYFHPENSAGQVDTRSLMDRRASHVAMFYDHKRPDGQEFVHHIDNPNSYGPQFNHAPDRNMPFHIFRYKPKGTNAETSRAYGMNARNWGFINDDRSPFADFFTLTLQKFSDLEKFKRASLAGEQIPQVYCSGLAWTNLNLGINHVIKPGMVRAEGYSRQETEETYKADVLAPALTQGLREKGDLLFDPYTTSDLSTAWLDNTFAAMPANAECPEGKTCSRRAVANKEETIQGILQGLQQLAWSDSERTEKREANVTAGPVATPARVKAWADAYGLDATQGDAWLGRNAEIKTEVNAEGINPAGKTPMAILRELELKTVSNRFVGPRIWMDEADHRQWAADPRILPTLPAKKDVDLVYVGTVINCELLANSNGNQASACLGTGGRIKEFTEGGADTSTYPHYAIANGGERTHRRFDASPFSRGKNDDGSTGARSMGKGTKISVRATTAEAKDLLVLFHTPEQNATLPDQLKSLKVKEYDKACTKMYRDAAAASGRASCAPKQAIVLDLKKSQEVAQRWSPAEGKVEDATYTFDLSKVCTFTGPKTMKCTVAEQGASGWQVVGEREVSREIPSEKTKGLVSATLVDKAAVTTGEAGMYLCPSCQTGGAQFNQWVLTIRDDQ